MRAKEYAKLAPEDKIRDAIPRQGSSNIASGHAVSPDIERPAVPPAKDDTVEMEEIPIAGRTKMTVPKNKGIQDAASSNADSESSVEEPVDHLDAKSELNSILKRSPSMMPILAVSQVNAPELTTAISLVVIFSKSYCPYSKKAKSILLDQYTISPRPFVVELDQHPIGLDLQALLAENTGRRTVPNVLVNGKSIGGGDDIAALDHSDELASLLRQMGGKWVSEVTRAATGEAHL